MLLGLLLVVAPLLTCCWSQNRPVDCSDIFTQDSSTVSGVYTISFSNGHFDTQVYCDMDTAGGRWTVIQSRSDGTVNFYRPWDQYVYGFGNPEGEYWLARPQELRVDMEDFEGHKVFAYYSNFTVGPECDGYRLNVSGFTDGGAGDSLTFQNGMKFSTLDNDQDADPGHHCACLYLGGFWYNNCHYTNPNGIYLWGNDSTIFAIGTVWRTWKGYNYSLKSISMKIRPKQ